MRSARFARFARFVDDDDSGNRYLGLPELVADANAGGKRST
jgi:hypothetical protein